MAEWTPGSDSNGLLRADCLARILTKLPVFLKYFAAEFSASVSVPADFAHRGPRSDLQRLLADQQNFKDPSLLQATHISTTLFE